MKKRTMILFAILPVILAGFLFYAFGNYSVGARAGDLTKLSLKGFPMFKTGEGELQLGRESGRAAADKSQSNEENPWKFSTKTGMADDAQNLIGDAVVIDYKAPFLTFSWFGDTKYRVTNIGTMDTTTKPEQCGDPGASGGMKSDGQRVGRIVKATTKGTIFITHEISIQIGSSGNQFIDMSIPDNDLYDCAMTFLRTGTMVRVHYGEAYIPNPLVRKTAYTVTALTPVVQ